MKLAEALAIRKDTQKRIEQLKSRILNNVRVQEGDDPSEKGCAVHDGIGRYLDTRYDCKDASGRSRNEESLYILLPGNAASVRAYLLEDHQRTCVQEQEQSFQ